ncbi:DUF2975 domain-containing protein [Hymenobacter sp. IS2118]|uniref:DUF2975 domain-containing protein n=1 Tax=Hymenobacter sp. IS2118 TaxID=1505605 RepID=UPI0005543625|nr:DUF2975 domain-containing protein [Hymenobacter sp. IS2118]
MQKEKMKHWFGLKSLLLLSRVVVGLLLFGTFVFSIQAIGRTYDIATGGSEVRLALNTFSPNLFPAIHDTKAGLDDGWHGRPLRADRGPLPALQVAAPDFELAANPREPLLRYREPTPWKRVALFHLGASDSLFSLPWLFFLSIGSCLLWRLLRDVTPATPFTFANARRLSNLALLVLGSYIWEQVAYVLVRALVPAFRAPGLAETLNHHVSLNTEHTLPSVWVGVGLTVIALVYRRGVELSQEAELVI